MDFILYVVVLLGCSYVGYGFGSYYEKRHRFYLDLIAFSVELKTEISFSHTSLEDIVSSHIKEFDRPFQGVLKAYLKALNNSEYITVVQLKKNIQSVYLEENELNEMLQFFNFLGKSDSEAQVTAIDKFIISFNSRLHLSEGQKHKYSGLFKKLGFLAGILIVVIML